MDTKIIFSILKIGQTKDKDKIKEAYRNILVNVNPEDDTEGFKRLRKAYEEALSYAEKEDDGKAEAAEKNVDTPVGKWIEQVKTVYASLSKRTQEDVWKVLLKNEVCVDLDTSMEARKELITFLMEHYRLKINIWKLLDTAFFICEQKKELYETFPKGFVDYMVGQCQKDEDFSYELFEGEDNADYDTFLYQYIELIQYIDEENLTQALQIIEILESMPIYHPGLDLEKARYAQACGETEKAVALGNALLEKYTQELRIVVYGAEILWKNEQYEKAALYFEKAIELYPNHYLANKRLTHYYLVKKEYEKAKTYGEKALEISTQEEEVVNDAKEINDRLIEAYEKDSQKEEGDFKRHVDMAWCYLQNRYAAKGIEQLANRVPPQENGAAYYSVLGRLYFMDKQYEKTVEHANNWITCIKKEEPKTKEEEEEIPIRIGAAYEIMSQAYWNMAKKDESFYEKAIEKMNQAIAYDPEDINYLEQKGKIYLEQKQYQQTIDMCDQIVEKDPDYFWSYILLQEAYYGLKNGQEVVDNFYKAKKIYPYYPNMYERTVEVFQEYDQYKDACGILKQAEEFGVTSNRLEFFGVSLARQMAESEEDFEKALKDGEQLLKKLKEQQASKKEISDLLYEISRCLRGLNKQDEALSYIEEAMELHEQEEHRWLKANILLDKDKYQEALDLYLIFEQDNPDNEMVLERIGYCYKMRENDKNAFEDYEKSLQYYKRVLDLNEENPRANSVMVDIYRWMYGIKREQEYYEAGILHVNRQMELDGEDTYYYNKRGLLHMDSGVWEKALEDFRKASELEPDSVHPYINIGCVYKYTEKYEMAIEVYEKAAQMMKPGETKKVYGNLGDCYERMGLYEKAIETYQKNEDMFPEDKVNAEDIFNIYQRMGRYEEALEYIGEVYEEGSEDYLINKGDVYAEMNREEEAIACYEQVLSFKRDSEDAYTYLGDLYLDSRNEIEKAVKYYKKALALFKKEDSDYRDNCVNLMKCYYLWGKPKKAKKYFDDLMESYEIVYGGVEAYLKPHLYLMSRLYTIGCSYLYIGEIEKAEAYFKRMDHTEKCRSCSYTGCREYFEAQGQLNDAKGNKEMALACYKKVLSITPNILWCRRRVLELSEAE